MPPQADVKFGIAGKITALFSLLILLTGVGVGLMVYATSSRQLIDASTARLAHIAEIVHLQFAGLLREIDQDVLFLARLSTVRDWVEAEANGTADDALGDALNGDLSAFLEAHPAYIQVRYVGVRDAGREVARVDREGAKIVVAQEDALRQRAERDYFQDTLKLPPGVLYMSNIGLDWEYRQAGLPDIPVLRVSTPVYTAGGQVAGIIAANLHFGDFFESLRNLVGKDTHLYIANERGDFLIHPDPAKRFGFDLGKRYLLQEEFPGSAALLQGGMEPIKLEDLARDDGKWVAYFEPAVFDLYNPARRLIIGVTMPHAVVLAGKAQVARNSLLITLGCSLLGILLARIMARLLIRRPLQAVTRAISQFGAGDPAPAPRFRQRDEIGALDNAFRAMTAQIQDQFRQLADEKNRLKAIFDNLVEGIVVTDRNGIVEAFNPGAERIFGHAAEEVLGRSVNPLIPLPYARRHDQDIAYYLKTGKSHVVGRGREAAIRRKDGSRLDVYLSISEFSAGGEPKFVGILHDLSETKRYQAALEEAKERAEMANRAKSAFLANMSHELRTPLNGILGYAQILQNDPELGPRQREGIGVIRRSGEYLLNLINEVLDLSKIEAERLEIVPAEFHLGQFLEDMAGLFRIRAEQKAIAFTYRQTAPLPACVHGDEQRLRQVLINLLGNAIKFTERGEVCLEAHWQNGRARFEVVDTGPGIAAADLEKIFQPFQQVGEVTRRAEGTGLGLTISKKLVELMGGDLQVDSAPGQGSRFRVQCPLPECPGLCPAPLAGPGPDVAGYHGPRRTLLIADDKDDNRGVLVDMLAPLGFHIAEAREGREALAKIREVRPDLVFMDLIMPVMDGFEAIRRLRAWEDFGNLPVIAISASVFEDYRRAAFEAGCTDFLSKPVRLESLLDSLQTHLGLSWIVKSSAVPVPPDNGAAQAEVDFSAPEQPEIPPEHLHVLLDLTQQGDIQGLRDYLEQLDGALYGHPLLTALRKLAEDFEINRINSLLQQWEQRLAV